LIVGGETIVETTVVKCPLRATLLCTFTNVESNTAVRCYKKGEAVFVASTFEAPGPFELVRIRPLPFA
jgi:hypothetical protein